MSFPTSPTNGQTATINGITYTYSSTDNTWKRTLQPVGNLTVTGNVVANVVYTEYGIRWNGNGAVYGGGVGDLSTYTGNIAAGNIFVSTLISASSGNLEFDPNMMYLSGPAFSLSNNNTTVTALSTMPGEPSLLGTLAIQDNEKKVFTTYINSGPARVDFTGIGIARANINLSHYPGELNGESIGIYDDGVVYGENLYAGSLPLFGAGDTVDIAVDRVNDLLWVRVNGGDWNEDPGNDPATATGNALSLINFSNSDPIYPVYGPYYYSGSGDEISIVQTSPYSLPGGFTMLAGTPSSTYGNVSIGSGIVQAANLITANGVYWSNGAAYSGGGSPSTYGNANVKTYLESLSNISIGLNTGIYNNNGENIVRIGYAAGQNQQKDYAVAIGYQSGILSQGIESVALGREAGYNTQGNNSTALGTSAGRFDQGQQSVAVGYEAATQGQGNISVAVGYRAGYQYQGNSAIAVGQYAGYQYQGNSAIAVGQYAGYQYQGIDSIAVGQNAGYLSQGTKAVGIGYGAGYNHQGINSIAIGQNTGSNYQGNSSISIGDEASNQYQGNLSISIGKRAGDQYQGNLSIAIGAYAANITQGIESIAIGNQAAPINQGTYAVAIGSRAAGNVSAAGQGAGATAIGQDAGYTDQGVEAVAIGIQAGWGNQGVQAVAVGPYAGYTGQQSHAVAIGYDVGGENQGTRAIAIGSGAGTYEQGAYSIALGDISGHGNPGGPGQGTQSVAIGRGAGQTQGNNAVAIGTYAGSTVQDDYSVAIGYLAGATNTAANSIILSTQELNSTTSGFFVDPVRNVTSGNVLVYDTNNKEVLRSNVNIVGQTGTPSNTTTPASWLQMQVAGVTYYMPLYQ